MRRRELISQNDATRFFCKGFSRREGRVRIEKYNNKKNNSYFLQDGFSKNIFYGVIVNLIIAVLI